MSVTGSRTVAIQNKSKQNKTIPSASGQGEIRGNTSTHSQAERVCFRMSFEDVFIFPSFMLKFQRVCMRPPSYGNSRVSVFFSSSSKDCTRTALKKLSQNTVPGTSDSICLRRCQSRPHADLFWCGAGASGRRPSTGDIRVLFFSTNLAATTPPTLSHTKHKPQITVVQENTRSLSSDDGIQELIQELNELKDGHWHFFLRSMRPGESKKEELWIPRQGHTFAATGSMSRNSKPHPQEMDQTQQVSATLWATTHGSHHREE